MGAAMRWLNWRAWFGRPAPPASPPALAPELPALERKLGHHFADRSLIETALTHRSHAYRSGQERLQSNERLEFLGDSVLGLIVNDYLFRRYPDLSEGELTKMKSLVVSRAVLSRAAESLQLGRHLILAPGEVDAGGRNRASILSDAFEAVLGALYLDGGLGPVQSFVQRELLSSLEQTLTDHQLANYKSLLQEKVQAQLKSPPRYKVTSTSGPDHAKRFVVEVVVRGRVLGRGEGNSKKLAEQRAAREALRAVEKDPGMLPGSGGGG
jgi:ribonuclease-3